VTESQAQESQTVGPPRNRPMDPCHISPPSIPGPNPNDQMSKGAKGLRGAGALAWGARARTLVFMPRKSVESWQGRAHACVAQYFPGSTGRCHEINIHNVHLRCHLFDTLVVPILNYGCEIWGPYYARKGIDIDGKDIRGQVEKMHLSMLRQCLGIRRNTAGTIIMHELDRKPITSTWIRQTVRFWNKTRRRPENDLLRVAMQESCSLAREGFGSWAAAFNQCLSPDYNCLEPDNMISISEDDVVQYAVQKWWDKCMSVISSSGYADRSVRTVPSEERRGFKTFTYFKWFAPDAAVHKQRRWWFHLNDKSRIQALAQFRLGSHWLQVERGRFTQTPRNQRVCTHCDAGERDDEMHMLCCSHYAVLHQKYSHILPDAAGVMSDDEMRKCMNGPDGSRSAWNDMAAFVLQCKMCVEGQFMQRNTG
jgi:hypothetical protein